MIVLVIGLLFVASGVLSHKGEGQFPGGCVKEHNAVRAKHGVPPLKPGDSTLQAWALKRSKQQAANDKMEHLPKGNKYGENLWQATKNMKFPTCQEMVDVYYKEIKDYNWNKPGFSMKTGHFTQVVWKNTKSVACAHAANAKGNSYFSCEYDPPGNVNGAEEYKKNVLKPKSG